MTRPEPASNFERRKVEALERIATSLEKIVEMGQPARIILGGSRDDLDFTDQPSFLTGEPVMTAKRQPPITTPAARRTPIVTEGEFERIQEVERRLFDGHSHFEDEEPIDPLRDEEADRP